MLLLCTFNGGCSSCSTKSKALWFYSSFWKGWEDNEEKEKQRKGKMTMIEARGPIKGAVASCFLLLSSCIILGCGNPSCFHLLSSWITLGKTKNAALLLGVVLLISQVNIHNGNVDITSKFWCIFCLLALPVTIRLREKKQSSWD
jgi:hypothetical protein